MVKFVFKWAFRLVLAGVILTIVAVVTLLLSLDTILRVTAERNIHQNTGLEAHIGRFHLGLTEPVVRIENLKLYNSPNFGGGLFLAVPEVEVVYDRSALAQGRLHVAVLRLNLAELDIVKNEAGQTNLFLLAPPESKGVKGAKTENAGTDFRRRTGLKFEQIDVINLSIGEFKYVDLGDPRNNRRVKVDLENVPVRNVRDMVDLLPISALLAYRSGDFFTQLVMPAKKK